MGVENSPKKKNFDKKKFKSAFKYYPSDKSFINELKKFNDKRCIIFDGAIPLEEQISLNDTNQGKTLFEGLFNLYIKPYVDMPETIPVIVFILDLSYRPSIKDLDTRRHYDPNAKLFKEVSDRSFPISKDCRDEEISKCVKCLALYKDNLKKVKEDLKKAVGYSIRKNKVSVEKLKHDKYRFEIKIDYYRRSMDKLLKNKAKWPVDCWKDGKGNPENRKMVYKYLTQKFINFLQKHLKHGQIFILDGAINKNNDFCSIKFKKEHNEIKKIYSEGYQMGEGEQGLIWYTKQLKKLGFSRFIHHTIDTDIFTYCGANWNYLNNILSPNNNKGVSIFIRCKNFKKGKIKPKNPTPLDNLIHESSIYICSFTKISQMIKREYGHFEYPVLTYYLFKGIYMGCDFIRDAHKTIQLYHSGKKGSIETDQFLDYFFNQRLKFRSTEKLFEIHKLKNKNFENGVYYYLQLNVKKVLEALFYYRKKYNIKNYTYDERLKLVAMCLNTNYVANYFLNQHRIINPIKRRIYDNCELKDKDGCRIYGYEKDEFSGRIIQSLNVPKKFLNLIK
jgi:hypothetical protein